MLTVNLDMQFSLVRNIFPPRSTSAYSLHNYYVDVEYTTGIYARFSQERYVVDESAGYVTLRVTVSGHRVSAISINVKVFVSSKFQPKAGN